MTLFLPSSEQAGSAEAEALIAGMNPVIGQAQVQRPEAADQGAGQLDIGRTGQGRLPVRALLDQCYPLAFFQQQVGQNDMQPAAQRQDAARPPFIVQDRQRQPVIARHGQMLPPGAMPDQPEAGPKWSQVPIICSDPTARLAGGLRSATAAGDQTHCRRTPP